MKKKILKMKMKQKWKKKRRMPQKINAGNNRNNRNSNRCLFLHYQAVIFINQQHMVASSMNRIIEVFIFAISF